MIWLNHKRNKTYKDKFNNSMRIYLKGKWRGLFEKEVSNFI